MHLSILICRLRSRIEQYTDLSRELYNQIKSSNQIEVKTLMDNGEAPVGIKRNALIKSCNGEYICFIDDDDRIGSNYISQVMQGIELGVDCCSMVGEITTNGKNPKMFVHSVDYDHYFEKNGVYYRPPNHLNVIRKSLVEEFKFPPINYGEDTDWAMQIARSKILENEYKVKETIYFYDYRTGK